MEVEVVNDGWLATAGWLTGLLEIVITHGRVAYQPTTIRVTFPSKVQDGAPKIALGCLISGLTIVLW